MQSYILTMVVWPHLSKKGKEKMKMLFKVTTSQGLTTKVFDELKYYVKGQIAKEK